MGYLMVPFIYSWNLIRRRHHRLIKKGDDVTNCMKKWMVPSNSPYNYLFKKTL